MTKERQHYELRPARKPRPGPLASTVLITNMNGVRGFCYVSFSDSFVAFVGKKLPRGIASFDPAYLEVFYVPRTKTWHIWAVYLTSGEGVQLWQSETKPTWLKFKDTHHGNSTEKAQRAASSASPQPDAPDARAGNEDHFQACRTA